MTRTHAHSGLTFLEVIVSITILAGISSIVFGVIGFTQNRVNYDRERLEAMEVAHRVIIQWIDDPEWIRSQPPRYEYAGSLYTFEVIENFLVFDEERGGGGRISAGVQRQEDVELDDLARSSLRVLDVRVWREDEEGFIEPEPHVHVTRTYWLYATDRGRAEILALMLEQLDTVGTQGGRE